MNLEYEQRNWKFPHLKFKKKSYEHEKAENWDQIYEFGMIQHVISCKPSQCFDKLGF